MSATAAPIGKFVWYEYMAEDLKAAVDFYVAVLGWTVQDSGMADFEYKVAAAGGAPIAGMTTITAGARAIGAKPSWMGYVWVENVDAAIPKLMAAGGKVFRAPSDIPGVGRFAVVADPYGGTFMLFRDAEGNPPPPGAPGTPGTVGWRELHADDGAKAFAFYSDLFGWNKDGEFEMGPIGVYHLFNTRHGEQGGIMTRMAETQAAFWLYYFNVEGADAAAERIAERGGRIVGGPHEVPGGRWTVRAHDPQGALFAVVAPKR
jgi:uncharacterized protein